MDKLLAKRLALKFLASFYEAEEDMIRNNEDGEYQDNDDFMTRPEALKDFGFIFDSIDGYLNEYEWKEEYRKDLRLIHGFILKAICAK